MKVGNTSCNASENRACFVSLLLGITELVPLYHFSPARERCSEMKRSESKRWKLQAGSRLPEDRQVAAKAHADGVTVVAKSAN